MQKGYSVGSATEPRAVNWLPQLKRLYVTYGAYADTDYFDTHTLEITHKQLPQHAVFLEGQILPGTLTTYLDKKVAAINPETGEIVREWTLHGLSQRYDTVKIAPSGQLIAAYWLGQNAVDVWWLPLSGEAELRYTLDMPQVAAYQHAIWHGNMLITEHSGKVTAWRDSVRVAEWNHPDTDRIYPGPSDKQLILSALGKLTLWDIPHAQKMHTYRPQPSTRHTDVAIACKTPNVAFFNVNTIDIVGANNRLLDQLEVPSGWEVARLATAPGIVLGWLLTPTSLGNSRELMYWRTPHV